MAATTEWTPRVGGVCGSVDPGIFFPDVYDDDAEIAVPSEIKVMCQVMCPFGRDGSCLKWAMEHDEYGFWAATSRYQRLQLDRDRHRVHCPGCRSGTVMPSGRGEICIACGLSWMVA